MLKTPGKQLVRLPPEPRNNCSDGVRQDVERIARDPGHYFGAEIFEEQRPKREVKKNLTDSWGQIVSAQAELAMEPQDGRQGTGDHPEIVKI